MSAEKVTVSALVMAPPDRVWRGWTEPAEITQWNFASDDWYCPSAEADLRVGGTYKARMEAKDGSFGFDFEAVYEAVAPGRALTLAMADGRRASTRFSPEAGGTRVTTEFDAETENPVEMQRGGWQAILDNFKRYIEAQG